MEIAALLIAVEMHQHTDRVRHPVHDAELPGAQQRHITKAERAGRGGRELGGEIVGRGEDDAHEIIVRDGIAFEHLANQRLRLGVDVGLRVLVEGRRAPQCQ